MYLLYTGTDGVGADTYHTNPESAPPHFLHSLLGRHGFQKIGKIQRIHGASQPMVPARCPHGTTPLGPLGALLGALHELVVPCAFSWVFNSLALKSAFWSKCVCIGMPAWWICTPEGLGASQNIPRRTPKLGVHKAKLGWQALAPHAKPPPQPPPPLFSG